MNEWREERSAETIKKKKSRSMGKIVRINYNLGMLRGKNHRSDSQDSGSKGNGFPRRNNTIHFKEELERI